MRLTQVCRTMFKPKVTGVVTYHLSPFQQKIVTPMFKDIPGKLWRKFSENVFDVGPAIVLFVGVTTWGEAKFEENLLAERPQF